ncbi:MAG: hypothetical protein J6T27_00885 [Alphaproteobacteria bacterium]|nr:hypothetical protein [Alphaproteobacteria bacterium]
MATEINTEKIFNQLKKQNGEKFAQAIRGDRDHDGNLLIIPNILHILEFAGHDENEARKLRPILKEIYLTKQDSQYHTDKNPLELLNEAGYDAFIVENEEQKNSIMKYYRPGEEICTFRDPSRHKNYYMIHAVKRGADKIKPSDHPQREDEYGRSVISIQIAKTGGFISIKNRYNHTVTDPDATFNNNPDNIIPGLSESLKRYFSVDFNTSENPLPDNFRMINDQIVRYNYEVDNVYFGPDYYFSGSTITKLKNDGSQIIMDYMILDVKNKTISSPISTTFRDDTYKVFRSAFDGKIIKKTTNKSDKTTTISTPDGNIVVVKDGKIVKLTLPSVEKIGNDFLQRNIFLTSVNLANVKIIGDNFISFNQILSSFSAPKLERTGKDFLTCNTELTELNLSEVTDIGPYSLQNNHNMISINLPKSKNIGYMSANQPNLKHFYAPELQEDTLKYFAEYNRIVAFAIATQRINKRIDEMAEQASKKMDEKIELAIKRIITQPQDLETRK